VDAAFLRWGVAGGALEAGGFRLNMWKSSIGAVKHVVPCGVIELYKVLWKL